MPDLRFQVESSEAVKHSATPIIVLRLKIDNQPPEQMIHSLSLRCQVQIEPARRHYGSKEKQDLKDLFGEPERWGRTVRPFLWMNTSVSVPGFADNTVIDLHLPCTFDFNVGATKYFHALEDGEVPLCLMFSGTVFYSDNDGPLQATQIPWDREAHFRLPVAVWRNMMDMHYPNAAWLCLQRDAFERLYRYKVQHGLPTWEEAIERLVSADEEVKV